MKTWIIICKECGMNIKLVNNKNIKKRGERERGRRNVIPYSLKSIMKSTY